MSFYTSNTQMSCESLAFSERLIASEYKCFEFVPFFPFTWMKTEVFSWNIGRYYYKIFRTNKKQQHLQLEEHAYKTFELRVVELEARELKWGGGFNDGLRGSKEGDEEVLAATGSKLLTSQHTLTPLTASQVQAA